MAPYYPSTYLFIPTGVAGSVCTPVQSVRCEFSTRWLSIQRLANTICVSYSKARLHPRLTYLGVILSSLEDRLLGIAQPVRRT